LALYLSRVRSSEVLGGAILVESFVYASSAFPQTTHRRCSVAQVLQISQALFR
jgi:hypothetical protein